MSVVVPAWNAEPWIGRALESAMSQVPPPVEVVVADDGSTDGTAAVAERFRDRVRLLRLPHRGQAAATNAAIDASSGEIVAPLHADDAWLPGRIARGLEAFERMPDCGVTYCDLELVDPAGRTLGRFLETKRHAAEGGIFEALVQQCFVLPSSAMIRRWLFVTEGLRFPEDLEVALDYEFWLRAARVCNFARVEEALVRRTVRPDSAVTRSERLHRDHVVLMRRLRAELVAAGAPLPAALDRRLAAFEATWGVDRLREGAVAEARSLLAASLWRRPTVRTAALWALSLAGRGAAGVLARRHSARSARGATGDGR